VWAVLQTKRYVCDSVGDRTNIGRGKAIQVVSVFRRGIQEVSVTTLQSETLWQQSISFDQFHNRVVDNPSIQRN